MEFIAQMGLMPSGFQSSQPNSRSSDSSQTFSQDEKILTSPRTETMKSVVKTVDQFYRDEFAMGDSAAEHSHKTTNLSLTIGPDAAYSIPTLETLTHNHNVATSHQATKIEKTDNRQPFSLTSRFSKVNFCMSLQADNDPAGIDFPVYRDLTVTVVQASSRHPLHGYDLKFTRAQVLYNGNGDLLVIYTPYLEEGIYQLVSDGKLTPHPDLPDTFMRQCCLLKRPDTDKMARGSQYLILGELKEVPTNLTETGDLILDMFVKFAKSKDFLRIVFPILLGLGHKDVWSAQLEVPEVIQPVCLNGNRAAFDSWFELHQLRATPSFEDCFSDRERFREYMNQRFNNWDHVTTECEYNKQMHTALCQGCRDCMSRESYIDSLTLRNITTKVAYNITTLSLLKTEGSYPGTPGRPRKKKKAGKKCWTKRSRASEERSLMSRAMSTVNPSCLDTASNKTHRVPEKLKYGFYKHSHPVGEDIYDTPPDSDASYSLVDAIDSATESKEISEKRPQNVGSPKGKRKADAVSETSIHKNTFDALQDISAARGMMDSKEKIPKMNKKFESSAKSSKSKSSLGKRSNTNEELPMLGEASTTDNLTNVSYKNAANELFKKSENSDFLKRKPGTTKKQRLASNQSNSDTSVTKEPGAKTKDCNDNTIIVDNKNSMETETPTDIYSSRSRRNRKRKAVCTCAGCAQSLTPPEKIVRLDKDLTKDDTVRQSASECRAN